MSLSEDKQMLAKAETLIEALPYFQRYAGCTFVVKYGGHAMGDPEAAHDFAQDIVLLKAVGLRRRCKSRRVGASIGQRFTPGPEFNGIPAVLPGPLIN